MNPTPQQLNRFALQFYDAGFLDIEPVSLDDGRFWVSLHDDMGNEIDELTFDDEATARRYIDWLVTNSQELRAIEGRTFAL